LFVNPDDPLCARERVRQALQYDHGIMDWLDV
jgi:hypothetical protein